MSGHSKWKNIMHKKEKTDSQRAKIFTKIGREITMAVKEGGPDPASNSKLKDIIAKAKSNNVPNDNIDRVIKKAAGAGDSNNYEEITYEGYGPMGVAVVVETLTDNRNRTAGDLRHYFDKCGGNLGQSGSVSWQFARKGIIVINAEGKDEEKLMDDAITAGAVDYNFEEGIFEIFTDTTELRAVKTSLEEMGYIFESAEEEMIPSNYVSISGEETIKKMNLLLSLLEDNDDVQNVWHNVENDDVLDF
ncbi:MAG: YebC/PmpR family DNA-binding transcriptional regulator [Ruminococcaceae bacterium]|nr:YebC/PmpR family DNA-binding transcriptional regulator [Oscillospiraceae bacterium]